MKIHFEHKSTVFEFERQPMSPERFNALCKLARAAIGGGVLLGLVHMLGVWGLVWPVGTLAMYGIYKIIQSV